jgi:hypothetical protein
VCVLLFVAEDLFVFSMKEFALWWDFGVSYFMFFVGLHFIRQIMK